MKSVFYCTLGMLTLSLSSYATSVDFSINPKSWEKDIENLKAINLSEISEHLVLKQIEGFDSNIPLSQGYQTNSEAELAPSLIFQSSLIIFRCVYCE